MSRIEELNDANIRVVYNDAGDIEALIDNKGRALNIPLVSKDVTGGIGILGPNGKQIGGDGSPIPLTTNRNAADSDNGQVLVCDAARTYTITAGRVSGFGSALVPFSGTTLTITGGAGVTINGTLAGSVTRAQSSNSAVAIMQVGADSYLVTGA